MKNLFLLVMAFVFSVSAMAQSKPAKAKTTTKAATKISVLQNGKSTNKLTIDELKSWADSLPLLVKGDNGKTYKLHSFDIAVIIKEPYMMQEFGTGIDGFPILARRAMDNMKAGDSIYLKNVMYTDEKNQDVKLPNLVVAVIEPAATK